MKLSKRLLGPVAVVARRVRARPIRSLGLALATAAAAFLATLFFSSLWIKSAAKDFVYQDPDRLPVNDVGVVLGTSKRMKNGALNLYFQNRIEAAAELLERGRIKHILVSGHGRAQYYDETSDMRDALLERGVPESSITMDPGGRRTLDSIVRAKEVFGLSRFTIVSQEYHNHRAVFIAQFHGCDVVAYSAREVDSRYSVRTEVRENLARVKALLDLYVLRKEPEILGESRTIALPDPSPSIPRGDGE